MDMDIFRQRSRTKERWCDELDGVEVNQTSPALQQAAVSLSTLLVNGCELGLNCPSLPHQRKDDDDDDDCDCCTAVREDSTPLPLTYRPPTIITFHHYHHHHSLTQLYTLPSPPTPLVNCTRTPRRHSTRRPLLAIATTDRQTTRRLHTLLLRQYYTATLQHCSLSSATPLSRWLAPPQSQARHGLTHQHHPPLRQHQLRGRTNTPNRLQTLRHMSRRDSYLPAM
jgi:hypothetical protein